MGGGEWIRVVFLLEKCCCSCTIKGNWKVQSLALIRAVLHNSGRKIICYPLKLFPFVLEQIFFVQCIPLFCLPSPGRSANLVKPIVTSASNSRRPKMSISFFSILFMRSSIWTDRQGGLLKISLSFCYSETTNFISTRESQSVILFFMIKLVCFWEIGFWAYKFVNCFSKK